MRLRLDLGAPPHRASASELQPPPLVVPDEVRGDFERASQLEWLVLALLLDDLAERR
jgi:hypothetical protein